MLSGPFGFEADAQGWTLTSTSSRHPTPVECWKPAAPGHGGLYSFQVVPYVDLCETILTSAPIDMGSGWVLGRFRRKQDTEACCDATAVE